MIRVCFDIGEKQYVFVANYDDLPLVSGLLHVADHDDKEPDMWVALDDNGAFYCDEDSPPQPWKGLPDFMAEKFAYAAEMHSML